MKIKEPTTKLNWATDIKLKLLTSEQKKWQKWPKLTKIDSKQNKGKDKGDEDEVK
jgi:hypothetical protein